ncbi:hypothetical protein FIV42_29220 [Persicimonas caeni]|uniref:DUF2993 domain-containing protein n=1 Tax=Persicimonas caeni TaxID=2292766 RepID=A0A4Y6Q3D7_PERCE|nr:hypothetical protein [Persicimonas caeni]QDG54677.1 hypothetical protein FIV42_29220 [Persicimonas caeni]QED35898.1 hypothetical protein FRD00_29215 [Persicimonas caeni]
MKRLQMFCLALALAATACSAEKSAGVKEDYESAIASEKARLAAVDEEEEASSDKTYRDLPVHFGLAIQRGASSKLVKRGLKAEFARALGETPGSISIAGQEIPLRLDTNLADVQLEADDSCATCVRVTGKVLGRFDVDVPLVKEDGDEAYEGKFSVVAPLRFAAADNGGVTLLLDTSQVATLGGMFAETKIEGLPSKIQPIAQKGLEKLLSDKLLAKFEPIELVSFGGVDFGVEGMKLLPAALSYDTKSKTIFAGVATNLEGIDGGIGSVERLGQNDAMAVRYHLQLLTGVLAVKMQQGAVARRYDANGQANEEGSSRVIVKGLRRLEADGDAAADAVALDFDVFHFGAKGKDYKAKGTARISMAGDKATVESVEFEGDDAPRTGLDTEGFKSAAFVAEALSLLDTTTTMPQIKVPGTSITVGTRLIQLDADTLTAFGGLEGLETTAEQ